MLPLVVYFHGGGQMQGSAFEPGFQAWGRFVARVGGVATCLVDFRNSCARNATDSPWGPRDPDGNELNTETARYPAGLNDCYSGLELRRFLGPEEDVDQ